MVRLEFEIESENGNYENWEYFVVYKDYSLTVPFIQYQNRANFKVLPKTLNHNERSHRFQNPYRILSQFTTCALGICCKTKIGVSIKFNYPSKLTECSISS